MLGSVFFLVKNIGFQSKKLLNGVDDGVLSNGVKSKPFR